MKKTKLVWRLGERPTSEELRNLISDEIISKEEARKILFNEETQEDRDKKSLEEEIKFLRKLVEKLSNSRQTIKEVIIGNCFYKKIFELPPKPKEETLEDKIERVNPYYTRNKSINYVGE
jgi:hypothetical protein